MEKKLNCWEIKGCEREPGGAQEGTLGRCPAAIDKSSDGINQGSNAGRICWAVAGTMCGGEVQGTFAQKIDSCKNCDVYHRIREEQGEQCVLSARVGTVADMKSRRLQRH